MSKKVSVDVISDIICPWCWVGKRAIELAAQEANVELELHWKPFQLEPSLGKAGIDKMQRYLRKYGPQGERMLRDPNNMLNQRGRSMGIEFVYHEKSKVFNTFDCHRLMYFADHEKSVQQQNALQEVLFRRYMKEGANLGEEAKLIAAAVEAGLEEEEVVAVLRSDRFAEEIQEELVESHAKCSSVPHFTFPGGRVISGGESIDAFKSALLSSK